MPPKFDPLDSIDVYKYIPKSYLKPIAHYKNYRAIQIGLPIRVVVAGSSGMGKSQCCFNLITSFGCFTKFYLCVGDPQEAIYQFLIDSIKETFGEDSIFITSDIKDIPNFEEFDPEEYNLIIFDDMINSKNNKDKNALDCFTMGRHANISIFYLSQDYYKINLTVRKNCPIVCLTRFNQAKDLDRILNELKGDLPFEEIKRLYAEAEKGGKHNYMTIVTDAPDNLRFRKNLRPMIVHKI